MLQNDAPPAVAVSHRRPPSAGASLRTGSSSPRDGCALPPTTPGVAGVVPWEGFVKRSILETVEQTHCSVASSSCNRTMSSDGVPPSGFK
ncbi:hypothetical protein FRC08_005242 [Ceratobasidium sp. 394]|nr:hypothetical protein FRC08_005242 [Ceratobasidium sp. 394]